MIFYFYFWILSFFFLLLCAQSWNASSFHTKLFFSLFELCVRCTQTREEDKICICSFTKRKDWNRRRMAIPIDFVHWFWFNNSKATLLHMVRREWQMWLDTVLWLHTCYFFSTFYDAFYLNEINLFLVFFPFSRFVSGKFAFAAKTTWLDWIENWSYAFVVRGQLV